MREQKFAVGVKSAEKGVLVCILHWVVCKYLIRSNKHPWVLAVHGPNNGGRYLHGEATVH